MLISIEELSVTQERQAATFQSSRQLNRATFPEKKKRKTFKIERPEMDRNNGSVRRAWRNSRDENSCFSSFLCKLSFPTVTYEEFGKRFLSSAFFFKSALAAVSYLHLIICMVRAARVRDGA